MVMNLRTIVAVSVALFCFSSVFAGIDADKIAAKCKVLTRDKMQGFDRIQFVFEDCMAWVVEPANPRQKSS
jgi:hypothetical protein